MQILVTIGQKMGPQQLPPLNINAIVLQLLCTTLKKELHHTKSALSPQALVIIMPKMIGRWSPHHSSFGIGLTFKTVDCWCHRAILRDNE